MFFFLSLYFCGKSHRWPVEQPHTTLRTGVSYKNGLHTRLKKTQEKTQTGWERCDIDMTESFEVLFQEVD